MAERRQSVFRFFQWLENEGGLFQWLEKMAGVFPGRISVLCTVAENSQTVLQRKERKGFNAERVKKSATAEISREVREVCEGTAKETEGVWQKRAKLEEASFLMAFHGEGKGWWQPRVRVRLPHSFIFLMYFANFADFA